MCGVCLWTCYLHTHQGTPKTSSSGKEQTLMRIAGSWDTSPSCLANAPSWALKVLRSIGPIIIGSRAISGHCFKGAPCLPLAVGIPAYMPGELAWFVLVSSGRGFFLMFELNYYNSVSAEKHGSKWAKAHSSNLTFPQNFSTKICPKLPLYCQNSL